MEEKVDKQYEAARKRALKLLDQPFKLGGKITATRDELHERESNEKGRRKRRPLGNS